MFSINYKSNSKRLEVQLDSKFEIERLVKANWCLLISFHQLLETTCNPILNKPKPKAEPPKEEKKEEKTEEKAEEKKEDAKEENESAEKQEETENSSETKADMELDWWQQWYHSLAILVVHYNVERLLMCILHVWYTSLLYTIWQSYLCIYLYLPCYAVRLCV